MPVAETEEEISTLLETELGEYLVIARLDFEKMSLNLPVISETSEKAQKDVVCYCLGPEPVGEGNLVTGHNYRNGTHFGRLDELAEGDTVTLVTQNREQYRCRVVEK